MTFLFVLCHFLSKDNEAVETDVVYYIRHEYEAFILWKKSIYVPLLLLFFPRKIVTLLYFLITGKVMVF